MNKASGDDGIPVELFHILKDDAVKVLHSICQQIRKTQRLRWLDGITDSMDMGLGNFGSLLREGWTGKPGVLQSTGSQGVGHD